MATSRIPNGQGFVRQLGVSDTLGELWSTFNIDLHTNPGKIKLARPFKRVRTSTQLDDETVEAFLLHENFAYALTEGKLDRAQAPYTSWSESNDNMSSAQDLIRFDTRILISSSTNIGHYNTATETFTASWWTATAGGAALNSGVPHIMEISRIGEETLVVTDGSQVHAYTGTIAAPGTLVTVDIDDIFTACCFKTSIRSGWIGTYTEDGDQAFVFDWDVASTNYTQAFPVGAKAALAMEIIDNVPLIITERGEIKVFNGAGFTTKAQFPFATKPLFDDAVATGLIQDTNVARPVHPKGMRRQGNTVFINANFTRDDLPLDERTPAGTWALDLSTWSLSHVASPDNESSFISSSPLMVIQSPSTRIFTGGRKTSATNSRGIWIEDLDDASENRGYLTTVEIESGSIKDVWDKVVAHALLGEDDTIGPLKYRTTKDTAYPVTVEAAWLSTTVFNSTDTALAAVKDRFDSGERDEVEVLLGSGSGRLAHVTDVSASGEYPTEGLIGHWRLDETAASTSVADSNGTQAAATASQNASAMTVPGQVGTAFSFNGTTDYVNIPHDESQLVTGGFTIAALIKPDTVGENAGRILDKSADNGGTDGYFLCVSTTNRILLRVDGTGSDAVSATGSVVFGDGNWYRVIATVSGGGLANIYVNGVLSGAANQTVNPLSGIVSTADMRIGNRSAATDRSFDGTIDEVKLFNRALTAAEVVSLDQNMSSATYSVTIDEELGTAAELATVRIDNWKKLDATMTASDLETKVFGPNAEGSYVQFRVPVSGKAGLPEIRALIAHSNSKQTLG